MGVKGLTTYLKENRHKLSHSLELRSNGGTAVERTNVVVDGWSLIFALHSQSGLPWVYGGEYLALSRHAENLVSAWIRVGLRPTFVFDGPTPPLKYPTSIARRQDSSAKSNLFFRTSRAARTSPSSLSENFITPPLGYNAIISTLLTMEGVDVKFAEGEADPYIVTLAGKLQAYVVAKDSDFIVLNSEGYRGYIPLDELVWSIPDTDLQNGAPIVNERDSDFQTVTKRKQRKQTRTIAGIIPPTYHDSDLVLLVTVYDPSLLAAHVDLPLPLLPLLGALIGNDYSSLNFFRSDESLVERVERVASTLSSVLKDIQSNNAKKVRRVFRGNNGGAMDVIGTTIERLLLWRDPRNPPENRDIDQFTETIVQSTLEYAVGTSASLFPDSRWDEAAPEARSGSLSLSRKERVQGLYYRAYHQGALHYRLMETFCQGVCFPGLFLEDPDKECVARSIGGPIRYSIWQLFVAAGGIPESTPNEEENKEGELELSASDIPDPDEDDELIDVIEDDSDDAQSCIEAEMDPLAVLRGRIQRMSFSESEIQSIDVDHFNPLDEEVIEEEEEEEEEEDEFIEIPRQPKTVTEYLRKGARLPAEEIQILDIEKTFWYDSSDKMPIQLRPLSERINVFLKLLKSDTSHIRTIMTAGDHPSDGRHLRKYVLWVVAYRCILQTLHSRCEDAGDNVNRKRLREEERWTRTESEAFFCALSCVHGEGDEDEQLSSPPVTDRAIQLTAQLLAAFEAVQWLAQVLLLMAVPGQSSLEDDLPLVLGESEKIFSGRLFHAFLSQQKREHNEIAGYLLMVASKGLVHMVAEPKAKKTKKIKKAAVPVSPSKNFSPAFGRFSALVDVDDI